MPDRNRTPHPLNNHSPRRAEPVPDHPAHTGSIVRPYNERSLELCFFTPCILLQLLTEQHCALSELQQRTDFDPAELKPLRAARKIHLDTLNRIAAGLNVPPDSLLIAPGTPWSVHDCDHETELYGFKDAFNLVVDYSPYYQGPLFK